MKTIYPKYIREYEYRFKQWLESISKTKFDCICVVCGKEGRYRFLIKIGPNKYKAAVPFGTGILQYTVCRRQSCFEYLKLKEC